MSDNRYSIPEFPYLAFRVFDMKSAKYCVGVAHIDVGDEGATLVTADCREFDTQEERDAVYYLLSEREICLPDGLKVSYVDEARNRSDLKHASESLGALKVYCLIDDEIANMFEQDEVEEPDLPAQLYKLQTKLVKAYPFLEQLRSCKLEVVNNLYEMMGVESVKESDDE